jgi:hypothetical protein
VRLKRQLETLFAEQGVTILGIGIGALKVTGEVSEQRIRSWQSTWQSKIAVERAETESRASRRITLARARAQIELIQRIVSSIETMKQSQDAELADIVSLRVVEALEAAQSNELVKALLPQQSLLDARQVLGWLQPGAEEK